MAVSSRSISRRKGSIPWSMVVDLLILGLWGAMLVRFWVTGQMALLLHPDYQWLAHLTAILLLGLAALRGRQIWQQVSQFSRLPPVITADSHISLLPRQISTSLLLAVAVFGLIYTPRPFTSDTALQRGITDTLTMTRSQPQRFTLNTNPEERTIIDWVRTLNVYPEPDAYAGKKADVAGFVIYPPGWSENYLMISRFVLTCCAADAYPVGLPVRLAEGQPRPRQDTWLQVQGQMTTDTLDGKRQLVIDASQVEEIPEPRNPYEY
ncbi:TIGR03943 family protein [Pseudanabaena sp. FACHB-2040]|uniref:TIGR03943 family putative permease subunit n=1 Tax=Pseudanabaena sp. FACHB-2040 TaxID=2692859 RepID=UPI001681EAC2|nr:TIGR03943 family protein [Pseudanabaena sp. FACHB-2040]MBD2257098.1 TIGR03943 family protein [Pseudanabaena sp. FACHB-2040]